MSDASRINNGLNQGDALTPVLFNFALDYAIKTESVEEYITNNFMICTADQILFVLSNQEE